jgi:hypothetical protein
MIGVTVLISDASVNYYCRKGVEEFNSNGGFVSDLMKYYYIPGEILSAL